MTEPGVFDDLIGKGDPGFDPRRPLRNFIISD